MSTGLLCIIAAACSGAGPVAAPPYVTPGPVPSLRSANATWHGFDLELSTSALASEDASRVHDAWKVARCVIRSRGFWRSVDRLTSDRSEILRQVDPGVAIRQVAARQWRDWRRTHGKAAHLHVEGTSLPHRRRHERFAATVFVYGKTISLRRWHIKSPLDELASTLIHEWLHTIGFRDPEVGPDPSSVVYGMTPTAREIARSDACTNALGSLYINPSRPLTD